MLRCLRRAAPPATLVLAAALVAPACTAKPPAPPPQDVRGLVDTMSPRPVVRVPRRDTLPPLSPVADSVAAELVFAPRGQTWFTAAARGKRMLVDIGRVDLDVAASPERTAGFQEAVARLTPIPLGTRFRLHGPWGADDAVVTGIEAWSGRIVAALEVPPRVDSLARTVLPLPATAQRTDSVAPPATASCARDSIPEELAYRAAFVRDSLEQDLRDRDSPPYERLYSSLRVRSAHVIGCYGVGRLLVAVSLRGGNNEWIRERFTILDDSGTVVPVRAQDFRLKGHDPLYAMDADGDGVDDLATRGIAENAGALSILRLDTTTVVRPPPPKPKRGAPPPPPPPPAVRRLVRLTSGFAWEAR